MTELIEVVENKRCSVCSCPTPYACSDCQIDRKDTIRVCAKTSCMDAHEINCSKKKIRAGERGL